MSIGNALNISQIGYQYFDGTSTFTGSTVIPANRGGTGVANLAGSTITLGGALTLSGAFPAVFNITGSTNVTFPTSGTLATTAGTVSSVSGTTNRITSTGGTTPVIDISASYVGQSSITTLGTIGSGIWQGTVIGGTYGGTGVNNGASTITLGGNLTTSGAFASTFTMTNTTTVTFPTSGTLATTAQLPSITATQYDVLVGGAANAVVSVGPGSAGQVLQSGGNAANPAYSTATYPVTATGTGTLLRADGTNWVATTATYPTTTTANRILYSSADNVVGQITTANNSALVTDGSGVPSLGTSLSNDFTYTSSTAGATRTLTVSNTNNSNTASNALIQTTTGGASAGDPFQTYTVTGATSWSQGIDNSDSDSYVLAASTALGTTNVMHSTTSGQITYPLQPAFLAYVTNQINDVTGDGTLYTIIFDTESYDVGSNFASGTFTAPVTGKYFLSGTVNLVGGTLQTNTLIRLTTSNLTYRLILPYRTAVTTTTQGTIAHTVDMDAADTATIVVSATDSGGKVDDVAGLVSSGATTIFSGQLIS